MTATLVSTRDQLRALLDVEPDQAVDTVRAQVQSALHGTHGVVLAGAGQVGRWLAANASQLGVEVRCFADNRASSMAPYVDGIPVLSPAEAVRRHGSAAFVVTIFHTMEVRAQLEHLGARSVVPWTAYAWANAEALMPYFGLDVPHQMVAAADKIMRLHDQLSDEASRRMLVDQVRWRLTLDSIAQDPPADMANIYAEPGVVAPTSDDVYVDCGAFDGDSIAMHLARTGGRAAGIVAIEADPTTLPALRARIAKLPDDVAQRVVVHHAAVGAERGRATFNATGTAGSSLRSAGTRLVEVDVVPLDEILTGTRATYIKMDVEGAEPLALAGARKTLQEGKAVWAVCLYHAADHLWNIPLQIAESGADYSYSMRRYAEDCWELVLYAVPADRATPRGQA